MRCGECGSFIIGERKFKTLRKSGKKTMYIYYLCSKYSHRECKQLPINEQALIPQLVNLIDVINIDKFLLKREFEYELKRFHKISDQLGKDSQKDARDNIDIRSQMKYVLENGSSEEKKRLIRNLGTKIYLTDNVVNLKHP